MGGTLIGDFYIGNEFSLLAIPVPPVPVVTYPQGSRNLFQPGRQLYLPNNPRPDPPGRRIWSSM